jgi:lipid II:glycine glycyltransferase (peptidoglycan interpeptide bridge formation enzyme)
MKIKPCSDPKVWEDFIAKYQPWNFLQSNWWSEVLRGEKKDVMCWELWNQSEKKIYGIVLLEKKHAARGGFYYLESLWGPVWSKEIKAGVVPRLMKELYSYIKATEDSIFWRLSPPASVLISPRYLESKYYFESDFEGPADFWNLAPTLARTRPPMRTLVLDLAQSTDEILAQMKPKTRYNINLAKRKGLDIKWSKEPKDLKEFFKLSLVTAKRGGFNPHQVNHYLNLLKTTVTNPRNRAELVLASHQGRIISANMVLFFNNAVYYLHGASSNEDRNLMATFLLQWEAIEKAKNEGFELYDFWGVDQDKWPGVTRFKEGFGGRKKDYPQIYEIPLRKVYYKMYQLYHRVKG